MYCWSRLLPHHSGEASVRMWQAWKLTGDSYSTHPGDKPWISEMYGYSFGAAKADVWHKYHTTAMIYPGYRPLGKPPRALPPVRSLDWYQNQQMPI